MNDKIIESLKQSSEFSNKTNEDGSITFTRIAMPKRALTPRQKKNRAKNKNQSKARKLNRK